MIKIKYPILVLVLLLGVAAFFAIKYGNWGEANAEPIQAYSFTGERKIPSGKEQLCEYKVYTIQQKIDTIQIANFEPDFITSQLNAPPQFIELRGKINNSVTSINFARRVRPYKAGYGVIDIYDFERIGCRVVRKPLEPERPTKEQE